jgi:hypothetical protein
MRWIYDAGNATTVLTWDFPTADLQSFSDEMAAIILALK